MTPERPKAALFDNDGLLLDTESVWSRAEQRLFETRGVEFTLTHKQALVGSSAEIAGRKLANFLGEEGRELEIMEELNVLVMDELEGGVDPMVGAVEILDILRGYEVPLGLVSNSPRPFILRSHEVAGSGIEFDVVVSGHEVPEAKPAPDSYLKACEVLGVEPGLEVVALEDSPTGVASASAAGLFVIGVPSVPGITLEGADLVASTLDDPAVLERLGIEPARPLGG
ncbi:MAG: HAD family hydrolase [Solirubrobacterales bacterium]